MRSHINGAAMHISVMDRGSRKGQARWNIISETGFQRELMVVAANSRVRDGKAWRCLDPAVIPACEGYRMPLRIKLETEPPIIPYILYLAQAREVWRCWDGLSNPMYEKM